MRLRTVFSLTATLVAIAAAGVSLWILRQPLQATYQALRDDPVSRGPVVRFAVVGDNHGVNPIYRQILSDLDDQPIDFLLNLADTTEAGTAEEFAAVKQLESALSFPVYHTVGNHDITTDPSRGLFKAAFGHAGHLAIQVDHVRVLILDNADRKVGFPAEDLAWLKRELTDHPDETVLLAYHRPFDLPLGHVVGDDETAASRITNREFKKILVGSPVKYIFTAHLHTYLPYTVANIPAVVSGGGGDPAQTVLGGPRANFFHYLLVSVQGSTVDVQVKLVQLRVAD